MVKNIDTASDWLNMFTKVSERLYLAFISKMPKRTREQQEQYNEQRRRNKSKSRQALFVSEYVQSKYFDVYSEACTFFNALNAMYATKYDLRKTGEFRQWKACINGEASQGRKGTPMRYLDIQNVPQMSTFTQTQPPPRTHTDTESPPGTPTESPPGTPTERPPGTPTERPPGTPTERPPGTPTERPPGTPTESPPGTPTESPPGTPAGTESPPQSSPGRYNDSLQLEIPLLDYNACKKPQSTVTTKTLEITTEQEIEPITINDIPSEKINEIIEQLRQDPDLSDIFSSVEQQMEFEQLGMDLDIPELNLLEEELFW